MPVKTITTVIASCDLCGKECIPVRATEATVNRGFRDVGPTTISFSVDLCIPYSSSAEKIVCWKCAAYRLRQSADELERGAGDA